MSWFYENIIQPVFNLIAYVSSGAFNFVSGGSVLVFIAEIVGVVAIVIATRKLWRRHE